MSKILQAGETGFGILQERDAGYVSYDENKHILSEGFEIKLGEPVIINCILQKWGVKNKNGRIYPKDVLVAQVNEYMKMVNSNSAMGEVNHPSSSVISVDNVSHLITKMWWGTGDQENILYGQLKLIVSPGFVKYGVCSMVGDKIVVYLQNKIKLGISSRGVGSLKEVHGENLVQNDFELVGFDLVSTPSTPGAYLFPANADSIKEEIVNKKESIYENKLINAMKMFID